MIVLREGELLKGQLTAALKRLARKQRKGASVSRFVGTIPFEGDPVVQQKAMRRGRH
ncbi:MAG: hypothetical protein JNN32_02185 [Flavobacteriales bacterium]|nr:hypothetical protein [Flavobacteriales bacterium]